MVFAWLILTYTRGVNREQPMLSSLLSSLVTTRNLSCSALGYATTAPPSPYPLLRVLVLLSHRDACAEQTMKRLKLSCTLIIPPRSESSGGFTNMLMRAVYTHVKESDTHSERNQSKRPALLVGGPVLVEERAAAEGSLARHPDFFAHERKMQD